MKSLGPSNDDSEAVRLEMWAAEMIAVGAYISESNVWANDDAGTITVTSDDSFFDEYNATLWPWDSTRPIAGQYEEWKKFAHDVRCVHAAISARVKC